MLQNILSKSIFRLKFSTKPFVNIYSSLILQRNPITIANLTEFEEEYLKYEQMIAEEKSRGVLNLSSIMNDHAKMQLDKLNASKKKKNQKSDAASNQSIEPTASTNLQSTSIDSEEKKFISNEMNALIEKNTKFYKQFENNTKSLLRALDRKLYLCVQIRDCQYGDGKPIWMFPYVKYDSNIYQSLNESARKIPNQFLSEADSSLYFVGKSPVAVYGISPNEEKNKSILFDDNKLPIDNFRVFFFRSQILSGGIDKNIFKQATKYSDYAWLTKEEIEQKSIFRYYESIQDVLSF